MYNQSHDEPISPLFILYSRRDDPVIIQYMTDIFNTYARAHADDKSLVPCGRFPRVAGSVAFHKHDATQMMAAFRHKEVSMTALADLLETISGQREGLGDWVQSVLDAADMRWKGGHKRVGLGKI